MRLWELVHDDVLYAVIRGRDDVTISGLRGFWKALKCAL